MGAMALPPGFRFHPTDEELVGYYLKRKIEGLKMELEVIPEIELYRFDPWQLPDKSFLPKRDLEWFFFCPRDKKYPNGSRTNRATKSGYWKATGKDRPVVCHDSSTGLKKTLVFYLGRAPLGDRTDWVMHEYRLYDGSTQGLSISESPFALCRIVKRSDQGQKIGDHPAETKKKRSLSSIMRDANSVRRASEVQTSPLQQMVFPAACSAEQLSDTSSRNSNLYTSEFSISLDPVGAPRTEISDLSCNNPTVNNLLNDQSTENQSETWCSANPPVGASILLPEENRLDLGVYSSQIGVMTPHRRDINDPQMMFEPDAFLYQNFEFPEQRRNAAFHNMGFDTRNVVTTPPICREASLDGNLGEICGMWFGEDGSVAVV